MNYHSKSRKNKNKSGKEICEICKEQNYLESHHIEGRKIKNANKPSNLVSLCPNCHEKIHRGDIVIEGKYLTTNGYELFWHKCDDKSFTGESKRTFTK